MALTWTVLHNGWAGDSYYTSFTVQFDNSYPTGGESISAGDFQTIMPKVMAPTISNVQRFYTEPATSAKYAVLDRTNSKLMLFTNGSTEAGNASDQSSVTLRGFLHYGKNTG